MQKGKSMGRPRTKHKILSLRISKDADDALDSIKACFPALSKTAIIEAAILVVAAMKDDERNARLPAAVCGLLGNGKVTGGR